MTALEPVAYEPSWRGRVLDLQREIWGGAATEDEWDWWFEQNPVGPRLFAVIPEGERVAAASGMSFFRMRLGGEETTAVFALDAVTHPDYRGRGLWSALELRNEEESAHAGAIAALGFTNPVAGPILVGKLGWRDLTRLRVWARPRLARGALGFRPVRGRSATLGVAIEPLARFGPETDALYAEVSRSWGNHIARDASYANWRFVDSPRPYRRFAARRDGRLEGYAVVTHKEFVGRPVGVVADLVSRSGRGARALLQRCATELTGGQALLAFVSPPDRLRYVASGFVPTHKTVRFIGKPLSSGVELARTRGAWHFTLGDMDVF